MKSAAKSSYNAAGSGAKPGLGNKSTVTGLARPGKRAAKNAAAAPVAQANGKVARPGFHQRSPRVAGGRGSVARPGGPEGISGRGNASKTKRTTTTDG